MYVYSSKIEESNAPKLFFKTVTIAKAPIVHNFVVAVLMQSPPQNTYIAGITSNVVGMPVKATRN